MFLSHFHTSASDGLLELCRLDAVKGVTAFVPADHLNVYNSLAWHIRSPARFPFVGVEAYLASSADETGERDAKRRFQHLTLYAFTRRGLRTMFDIMRRVPTINEVLRADLSGLIVCSGCMQSPFYHIVRQSEDAIREIRGRVERQGGVFALEVFPHDFEERPGWAEWVVRKSRAGEIRAIFATDAHAHPEDRDLYYFFLGLRSDRFEGHLHPMKGGRKFVERMRQIEHYLFPDLNFDTSHPAHSMNQWLEQYAPASPIWKPEIPRFPDEEFAALVEELRSMAANFDAERKERLEREISLIGNLQIPEGQMRDYAVLLARVFRALNKERIVFSVRGSGAASFFFWLLSGQRFPDPVEAQGLLERFINPYRVSSPDVDIDVGDQEAAFRVLQRDFYVYRLSAYVVYPDPESVIRDHMSRVVGKNLTKEDAVRLFRLHYANDRLGMERINLWAKRLAQEYQPLVRKSQHAGGLILIPKGIDPESVVPIPVFPSESLNTPSKEDSSSIPLSMLTLEDVGGMKVDILQVNSFQQFWNEESPRPVGPVRAGVLRFGTAGVFQLSGPPAAAVMAVEAYRDALIDLDHGCLLVASIRPGGSMEELIRVLNLNDDEKRFFEQFHRLEGGDETGVIIFQEDVMRLVANAMMRIGHPESAAWTLADLVRKAIAKKDESAWEKAKSELIRSGVGDDLIRRLERSLGYSFNRAHASAYANHLLRSIQRLSEAPIESLIRQIRLVDRPSIRRHEAVAQSLFSLLIHAVRLGLRVRLTDEETRVSDSVLWLGPDVLGEAVPRQRELHGLGPRYRAVVERLLGYPLYGMLDLAPILAEPKGLNITGVIGEVKDGRRFRQRLVTPYGLFPVREVYGHPARMNGLIVSYHPKGRSVLTMAQLKKDRRYAKRTLIEIESPDEGTLAS